MKLSHHEKFWWLASIFSPACWDTHVKYSILNPAVWLQLAFSHLSTQSADLKPRLYDLKTRTIRMHTEKVLYAPGYCDYCVAGCWHCDMGVRGSPHAQPLCPVSSRGKLLGCWPQGSPWLSGHALGIVVGCPWHSAPEDKPGAVCFSFLPIRQWPSSTGTLAGQLIAGTHNDICFVFHPTNPHPEVLNCTIPNHKGYKIKPLPYIHCNFSTSPALHIPPEDPASPPSHLPTSLHGKVLRSYLKTLAKLLFPLGFSIWSTERKALFVFVPKWVCTFRLCK